MTITLTQRELLPPKDWALKLLRGSSVTNWRDEIEYARWVRSVACAGAMGNEAQLLTLEREMQELASGYVRRANADLSGASDASAPRIGSAKL